MGVRQQLAEHAAGLGVERHAEVQVELVFGVIGALAGEREALRVGSSRIHLDLGDGLVFGAVHLAEPPGWMRDTPRGDRKSTRLNSSHSQISYAVFCLKKKKQ